MHTDPQLPANPEAQESHQIVRAAAVFYGICTLFAIGYALFSGTIGRLLGENPPAASHFLGAIGVGLVIVGVTRVAHRAWQPVRNAGRVFAGMLGPISKRDAIVLALMSGIGEELLFRGALWPHLDLPGTTCLFALVHIIPKRGLWWGYPLFALVAGLVLGLLRHGTGSVVPPMIAHVVVNAINLAWIGKNYGAWTAPRDSAVEATAVAHAAETPANGSAADKAPDAASAESPLGD